MQLSKAPMLKSSASGLRSLYDRYSCRKRCFLCRLSYALYVEGGQKFTDHHIQSPLNNVANSCQVCHRQETDQLLKDVFERQDRIIENRDKLEELIVTGTC